MKTKQVLSILFLISLVVSSVANAGYLCSYVGNPANSYFKADVVLKISNDRKRILADVFSTDSDTKETLRGKIDPTYKPRDKKYAGSALYITDANWDGRVELILSKELLRGLRQGFAQMRVRGEGYGADTFRCNVHTK